MLLPNDVLTYPGRTIRILWMDARHEAAYTFELGQRAALPQPARVPMLEADVHCGRARLLLADPASPPCSAARPAAHLALQAKAWEAIAPLVEQVPGIFQLRARGQLVAARALASGVSRASLLRYLRRYWERGQTPLALLPDYVNSGAPGKTRAANAHVKRGRPRKGASHPGLNADTAMRAIFHAAVARYRATHTRFSARDAYRQMLDDFFREHLADAVPTFGQFNYWIKKDPECAER